MLTRLYLKDFAVVHEAEAGFGPGMTVVSGETGAGKSLLVDALALLCGGRADSTMVRHGAERAELAAEFDLADAPQALAWLREAELDDGPDCRLRRVLRSDGGSRAWINGRPAGAGQLAELGAWLVEIHGQHEHQALLVRGRQLALLDVHGGHAGLLDRVRHLAAEWRETRRALDALAAAGDPGERIAYLRHQLAELESEALAAEEIEELQAAHRRLSHAAELIQGCDQALAQLAAEDGYSLGPLLRRVRAGLHRLLDHEPRLAEVDTLLESAGIQLDEAAAALERLRDDLDLDPQRLNALDARLARLHDLARKHRVALTELARHSQTLRVELDRLSDAGTQAARLSATLHSQAEAWREAAAALSAARRETGERLSTAVSALLGELGMGGGRFAVEFEAQNGEQPDPQGAERVEFLVSANPGQPPRPLRKVASGGELSRISLAIEVAALGADDVPSMVFDEVDSGIGGAVAEVVGRKLRALGQRRQVLCVTHLPQVAAQGHRHFQVSKAVDAEHAMSAVTELDEPARVEELARMLGGLDIAREARQHARQMLAQAQAD